MKMLFRGRLISTLMIFTVTGCLSLNATADLREVNAQGFLSQHTIDFSTSPETLFRALTESVASWWDASHSYSGRADAFSMDLRAGGCFCEISDNGIHVEHMRIVRVIPNKSLVMRGALGPLQDHGVNGSMQFAITSTDTGSRLTFQYSVGGYYPGGFDSIAPAVDQVLLHQLQRLKAFLSIP